MRKTKTFYNTKFPIATIETAHDKFLLQNGIKKGYQFMDLTIDFGDESWDFDSRGEFLASYTKAQAYRITHYDGRESFSISCFASEVRVAIKSKDRAKIEAIFNIFEKDAQKSKIAEPVKPGVQVKIFIGHGKDNQWRLLKDHLQDQHDYEVIAYEIGPRAGLSVKEVLETMLPQSSMALLVMTGEDLHNDGELHARENVIHEVGLFQGHLGFKRAIILKEDDVEEFSNILGINQIRFSKGNIRESFGDVIATIKREFEKKGKR